MAKEKKQPETVEVSIPEGIDPEKFRGIVEAMVKRESQEPQEPVKDFIVFKEWDSGIDQKMRVYKDTYKGRAYLSIRKWYINEEGYLSPGKGVTFSPEEIDKIIEGLETASEWCDEHPFKSNGNKY